MIIRYKDQIRAYDESPVTTTQFPETFANSGVYESMEVNNIDNNDKLNIADSIERATTSTLAMGKFYPVLRNIECARLVRRDSVDQSFQYAVAAYVVRKSDVDRFVNKLGKISSLVWYARSVILPLHQEEARDAENDVMGYNGSQDESLFGAKDIQFTSDSSYNEYNIDEDAIIIVEEGGNVEDCIENTLSMASIFAFSEDLDWFDRNSALEEYVVFPVPCAEGRDPYSTDPTLQIFETTITLDFFIPVHDSTVTEAIYNMSDILTIIPK